MVTEVSILIPIYNQDVTALVHTLLAQCNRLSVSFEIRLYDDGSISAIKQLNRTLAQVAHVVYQEMPDNLGRAAIRNRLADDARHDYLLFLDNDCLPVSHNFIFDYLKAAIKNDVVIGGISYVTKAPEKPYRLHWKYGKFRGSKCVTKRNQSPYADIYLCNAFIKKSLFQQFRLREKLKRYGHEDTLFAIELRKGGVNIMHITNPVIHLGLEKAPIMLAKTDQALRNLVELYTEGEELHQVRLIQFFQMLNKYRLLKLYSFFFSGLEGLIKRNLMSDNPNLWLFDLYRLHLFSKKFREPALIKS